MRMILHFLTYNISCICLLWFAVDFISVHNCEKCRIKVLDTSKESQFLQNFASATSFFSLTACVSFVSGLCGKFRT